MDETLETDEDNLAYSKIIYCSTDQRKLSFESLKHFASMFNNHLRPSITEQTENYSHVAFVYDDWYLIPSPKAFLQLKSVPCPAPGFEYSTPPSLTSLFLSTSAFTAS